MSRRTLRACDLMCTVMNWDNSIRSVAEELAELNNMTVTENDQLKRSVAQRKEEATNELVQWKRQREQVFSRLQRVVNAFTPEDVAHIRRRAPELENDLVAIKAWPSC